MISVRSVCWLPRDTWNVQCQLYQSLCPRGFLHYRQHSWDSPEQPVEAGRVQNVVQVREWGEDAHHFEYKCLHWKASSWSRTRLCSIEWSIWFKTSQHWGAKYKYMDRYCSSMDLISWLLLLHISIVGTLQKKRKAIPSVLDITKCEEKSYEAVWERNQPAFSLLLEPSLHFHIIWTEAKGITHCSLIFREKKDERSSKF